MSIGTEYIVKYLADISGAIKGAKEVEVANTSAAKNIVAQYGEVKRIVGNLQPESKTRVITRGSLAGQTAELRTSGMVIETVNGKYLQLSQTQQYLNGLLKSTSTDTKVVTDQFATSAIQVEKNKKSIKTLGENLQFLGMRALTVMPIWAALRALMQSTQAVFSDGFRDLVSESLALQKVKNTMQGTADSITVSLEKVKNETQSLALETGINQDKIIASYQKFSSMGLDFATSMAATNAIIKLSVITQSDAAVSAEAYAHAFGILIDTNANAIDKQTQINDIISLTAELWKTNGFNIEEFTGSLEKFAVTSKSVNFTTGQTLALLATLSKSGLGSAGNLLRNSIGQLLVNMEKLAGSLGVKVNPELDNTFSILMKVLGQLNALQKVNDLKGLEAAKEALKDIFGGTRSAVPITSLASLYDVLKKNIALTPDVNKLNDSFTDTENVLGNVVARFHTANGEIGKAFINGIVGGENFNASLEKVVETLNKTIKVTENLGTGLNAVFSNLGVIAGAAFLIKFRALLTVSALFGYIARSTTAVTAIGARLAAIFAGGFLIGMRTLGLSAIASFTAGLAGASVTTVLGAAIAAIFSPITLTVGVVGKILADTLTNNYIKRMAENELKIKESFNTLSQGLQGNLTIPDLIVLIQDLTVKLKPGDLIGAREIGALRKRLKEQIDTSKIEAQVTVKAASIYTKEETDIAKLVLANYNERLKQQGALNSQILIATQLRVNQLGIEETAVEKLGRKLEIERALSEEKRLQIRIGNDSLKLYDIAKTQGIEVARQVGEVLSGETDLSTLARRGGTAFETFKTQFEDLYKAKQGEMFFKGETLTGVQELQGGLRVPIQEEAIRNRALTMPAAEERKLQRLINVNTSVPVNFNTTLDVSKLDEVRQRVIKEISKQLPQVGTDVNNALVQALMGKQGKNL